MSDKSPKLTPQEINTFLDEHPDGSLCVLMGYAQYPKEDLTEHQWVIDRARGMLQREIIDDLDRDLIRWAELAHGNRRQIA